jgi:hypothetical protein
MCSKGKSRGSEASDSLLLFKINHFSIFLSEVSTQLADSKYVLKCGRCGEKGLRHKFGNFVTF